MNLTPREKDKLLIAMAATVARRRLERGVKLTHPEAIALITDFVVEGARDGKSVAELIVAYYSSKISTLNTSKQLSLGGVLILKKLIN